MLAFLASQHAAALLKWDQYTLLTCRPLKPASQVRAVPGTSIAIPSVRTFPPQNHELLLGGPTRAPSEPAEERRALRGTRLRLRWHAGHAWPGRRRDRCRAGAATRLGPQAAARHGPRARRFAAGVCPPGPVRPRGGRERRPALPS